MRDSCCERACGTWSEPAVERVEPTVARAKLAEASRPVLVAAARDYGSLVTYRSLSEQIQAATNIHTSQLLQNWIGPVLHAVAVQNCEGSEPLLTAFCVRADETVGPGYVDAVVEVHGLVPEDADVHAAEERFAAHRHFGAEIPADGGRPNHPAGLARKRVRAKRSEPRPSRAQCPNCFIELPVTGVCDQCDDGGSSESGRAVPWSVDDLVRPEGLDGHRVVRWGSRPSLANPDVNAATNEHPSALIKTMTSGDVGVFPAAVDPLGI